MVVAAASEHAAEGAGLVAAEDDDENAANPDGDGHEAETAGVAGKAEVGDVGDERAGHDAPGEDRAPDRAARDKQKHGSEDFERADGEAAAGVEVQLLEKPDRFGAGGEFRNASHDQHGGGAELEDPTENAGDFHEF